MTPAGRAAIRVEVAAGPDAAAVAARLAWRFRLDLDPRRCGPEPAVALAIRQGALVGVRWPLVLDAATGDADGGDFSPVEAEIVAWLRADTRRMAQARQCRAIDLQGWVSGVTRGVRRASFTHDDEALFALGVQLQKLVAPVIDWAAVLRLATDPKLIDM